jgi:hypothetical protein
MKMFLGLLITALWLPAFGQQSQAVISIDTMNQITHLPGKWFSDLFIMGIEQQQDSVYIREEVVRLVKDSIYRKAVYPQHYSWPTVVGLLQEMDLKKAFWHMINIYMEDTASHSMILGTMVLYDSLIQMDRMLINTFYTYAFTDPRVCRIENNKPDIFRPDLLEKYLRGTAEIINRIQGYRRSKN